MSSVFSEKKLDRLIALEYGAYIMKINNEKIRETIKELGLTIGQAAEQMGISRQGLQMILKNQSTLLSKVDQIAKGIGLDPKDILI